MSWETATLGDVCELYQPKTISTKEMVDDGEYVVFGANGVIGRYDQYNHEEPQLLITCRGATCGAVNVSTPKAWINGNAMVVRPKGNNIDRRFLEYLFRGGVDLSKTITGAAQPQITRQTLAPLVISYPTSLPEQQRIVTKLDAAIAALAEAQAHVERNRANARELFESYLNGVFEGKDWEMKRLQDVSLQFGRGKSKHRPRNDDRLYGGPYPFIQTGDVRNSDHVITSYSQTYSEFGLAQSKLWPKGTLCITIAANIAETAVLGFDACFPDSVIGMVADPKQCDIHYVEFLLQSFKTLLKAQGKGSAQDNINLGTFENQAFPFPPLAEQRKLAEALDTVLERSRQLESTYQQKLLELEGLKKGLLGAAFRGEL